MTGSHVSSKTLDIFSHFQEHVSNTFLPIPIIFLFDISTQIAKPSRLPNIFPGTFSNISKILKTNISFVSTSVFQHFLNNFSNDVQNNFPFDACRAKIDFGSKPSWIN